MKQICCICGKEFDGYGNNPAPLTLDEKMRCCDECDGYVISARIWEMDYQKITGKRAPRAEFNKALRTLRKQHGVI